MGPALGPTDSSATAVPDRSRGLRSFASIETEQLVQKSGDDFMRMINQQSSQARIDCQDGGEGLLAASQGTSFAFDLPLPDSQPVIPTLLSGPGDLQRWDTRQDQDAITAARAEQSISPDQLRFQPMQSNDYLHTTYDPQGDTLAYLQTQAAYAQQNPNFHSPISPMEYRPASAASTSEHTGSEYSYSATDMSSHSHLGAGLDGTAHMQGMGVANDFAGMGLGDMSWTRGQGQGQGQQMQAQGGLSPGQLSGYSGSAAAGPSSGPIRTGEELDEDPQARQKRLEHRRQINRKSAQKHRARRKEESETMSRQIAERDLKIANLERDLAVERAKVAQLENWMRSHSAAGPVAGAGSAHGRSTSGGGGTRAVMTPPADSEQPQQQTQPGRRYKPKEYALDGRQDDGGHDDKGRGSDLGRRRSTRQMQLGKKGSEGMVIDT